MYGGADVELNNRIGRVLLGIIPPDAQSITAKVIVEDDWSELGFEFTDGAGMVRFFDIDANPDDASREITAALRQLRDLMVEAGQDRWNRSDFTAHRSGEFSVTFGYEDDPEL